MSAAHGARQRSRRHSQAVFSIDIVYIVYGLQPPSSPAEGVPSSQSKRIKGPNELKYCRPGELMALIKLTRVKCYNDVQSETQAPGPATLHGNWYFILLFFCAQKKKTTVLQRTMGFFFPQSHITRAHIYTVWFNHYLIDSSCVELEAFRHAPNWTREK